MKKIWKNLCACSLALMCSSGLVACGDDEDVTSRDLDGDGVISTWETLYEDMEHSVNKSLTGNISFVSNADELLDINNHTDEQKVYVLRNDIDLGGREVSIDLGKSEFYGFNFVISNFKLATIDGSAIAESGLDNTYIKTLFRNGTGVFSTRIFMGVQSLTVDNTERNSSYYISPMFNVPVVSDVDVKGKISIVGKGVDNRIYSKVNASLLYTGMEIETVNAEEETVLVENITCIDSINVDGEIIINNESGSRIGINAGGIASELSKNSLAYNCYAQVKINSTSSEEASNLAGIIGYNKGFVSTCTFTGDISVNNDNSLLAMNEGGINIGGIVGTNDNLAEIKNCSTNAKITMSNKEAEKDRTSKYYVGGIVGTNRQGIVELCQSDAVLTFNNLNNITAGCIGGVSSDGVISYNICRGSITATNVGKVYIAQVVGYSKNGLLEKIVTTTSINIDNSAKSIEELKLGMVTIFDDSKTSPYFRNIMVDGVSQIYTREDDNSKVDYKQGLRYPYLISLGMEDEEEMFDIDIPDIFENLYSVESCKLYKYSLVGEVKAEDPVNIIYVNNMVGKNISATTQLMIDFIDFKNYLNHNEVSLDAMLNLNTLHFTISDQNTRLQSYFNGGKYNGELSYFDREFTKSYNHEISSLGSCENDTKDEMLSFVYDLIVSNNGKPKELYTIKVDKSYIDRAVEDTENINGLSADANIFVNKLCNVFGCLSTSVSITKIDIDGNVIIDDEPGSALAKYVEINFSDNQNNYLMKIDISNMQNTAEYADSAIEGPKANPEAFILYVTFTISNKIVN